MELVGCRVQGMERKRETGNVSGQRLNSVQRQSGHLRCDCTSDRARIGVDEVTLKV